MLRVPYIRTIVSLLLLQGILGSTLMVPLAYMDFELRKDYITKVLCINRKIPESGCEGKCFLQKRLSEANSHHNPQDIPTQERFQLSFFTQTIKGLLTNQSPELVELKLLVFNDFGIRHTEATDIFHPPQAC